MKLALNILFTALLVIMHMQCLNANILELDEDEQGRPLWKNGEYRDRNEIPLPPNYDEEKKHRRDVSDIEQEKDKPAEKSNKKSLIHRGKKGKKTNVPKGYTPNGLKLSEADHYAKLDVQTPDRKSSVVKTWGMTYDKLFPESPKETTGQSRSKLEEGYKITDEDLDSGMMFRGLGGLKLRDQNHQIIQSKFAEKDDADEEMNARSDVTPSLTEKKGLFHFNHIFNPFNHHHHHRPHHHHFKPTKQPTGTSLAPQFLIYDAEGQRMNLLSEDRRLAPTPFGLTLILKNEERHGLIERSEEQRSDVSTFILSRRILEPLKLNVARLSEEGSRRQLSATKQEEFWNTTKDYEDVLEDYEVRRLKKCKKLRNNFSIYT
eukprot:gene18259-20079_t